jgi:hypothetical protein
MHGFEFKWTSFPHKNAWDRDDHQYVFIVTMVTKRFPKVTKAVYLRIQGLWDANVSNNRGRAIAQAVSRWLPTAADRLRSQVKSCGICGGQSGTGAGFLRVLRFPLPILIAPTGPHSSSIIRGRYNRPNSGRRTKWTQSHPTPRN